MAAIPESLALAIQAQANAVDGNPGFAAFIHNGASVLLLKTPGVILDKFHMDMGSTMAIRLNKELGFDDPIDDGLRRYRRGGWVPVWNNPDELGTPHNFCFMFKDEDGDVKFLVEDLRSEVDKLETSAEVYMQLCAKSYEEYRDVWARLPRPENAQFNRARSMLLMPNMIGLEPANKLII